MLLFVAILLALAHVRYLHTHTHICMCHISMTIQKKTSKPFRPKNYITFLCLQNVVVIVDARKMVPCLKRVKKSDRTFVAPSSLCGRKTKFATNVNIERGVQIGDGGAFEREFWASQYAIIGDRVRTERNVHIGSEACVDKNITLRANERIRSRERVIKANNKKGYVTKPAGSGYRYQMKSDGYCGRVKMYASHFFLLHIVRRLLCVCVCVL